MWHGFSGKLCFLTVQNHGVLNIWLPRERRTQTWLEDKSTVFMYSFQLGGFWSVRPAKLCLSIDSCIVLWLLIRHVALLTACLSPFKHILCQS